MRVHLNTNGIADNSYFIAKICVNGSIPFPSGRMA